MNLFLTSVVDGIESISILKKMIINKEKKFDTPQHRFRIDFERIRNHR